MASSEDTGGSISAAARSAHDGAVALGAPSYLDPESGYVVHTEVTLRARGSCCANGCRHCPYPDDERAGADASAGT